jgi:hypothetical protein
MRTLLHTLLLMGALVAAGSVTEAQATVPQTAREVDLAVTYTAERSNLVSNPIFWRQGAAFALSAELFHGFGVGLNINGGRVSNINGTGINLTSITTTFGPRYQWSPKSGRFALFGEGLIGESHGLDGVFPSASGALTDYDTFATQVGGGVDLRVGHRFAVRPLQVDWIRTQFPNGTTNVQNSLRFGAGVVLRLQGTKR